MNDHLCVGLLQAVQPPAAAAIAYTTSCHAARTLRHTTPIPTRIRHPAPTTTHSPYLPSTHPSTPPISPAGYNLPLAGAGPLGVHRLVESMKHAFALRMSLGDPGPGGNQSYANVAPVLQDMLSQPFADSLRCAAGVGCGWVDGGGGGGWVRAHMCVRARARGGGGG